MNENDLKLIDSTNKINSAQGSVLSCLRLIATSSKHQLGPLSAQNFCDRINATANNLAVK